MLNTTVRARIDDDLKQKAESILREIGLNSSQAINIFFRKIVAQRGIPFDLKLPSENLKTAIDETKSLKGTYHEDIDSLMKDLKS